MLVLGRKKNEKTVITNKLTKETITLCIVSFRGSEYVRLGIDAPENYSIVREELIEKEVPNATT